ncbi:ATP-dependent DNA helicase PIF1-like [Phragmites australis]|uniref:ATP-dependent DNA helicase PIF1-like n=1 Tax=Phragmites australis TaxID=29695 RepID=UPI002D78D1DC|nr:ATP-dependent DNA helicase PIF1-like [Phragmites australis]
MGKDISSFPLPEIEVEHDTMYGEVREIFKERSIEVDHEFASAVSSLNREQRYTYDKILFYVDSGNGTAFFVDGPGGTGKTFLYKALLAKVRSEGKIAVATATSGVAASILPGGRTAHSRFKISLGIQEGGVCNFTKQSETAKLLRMASLILWDEVSMTKRQAIEALDKSLRDIMEKPDLPFGGKTIVFGGDFRQVLPVVRKGTRAQIINATLLKSYLWENMQKLRLVRNMRAQSDPWFSKYLLRIGNGTEETVKDDYVKIPDEICVPYTSAESNIDNLIDRVFPMLATHISNSDYITSRAILSTRNENVDDINMRLIERFPGDEMVYHSYDLAIDDPNNYYPPEFLNSLTPNGLPPHILKLKVNCPVILLRNLDPANGLCNGTRLIVQAFQRNTVDAKIVLGQHAGKKSIPTKDTFVPI